MKIVRLEYQCNCGAQIVLGDDDLRRLIFDIVEHKCVWCGTVLHIKHSDFNSTWPYFASWEGTKE
jgi:hypothetical protein